VGGLSYDADEDAIRELFGGCGEILSCRVPKFEDSGRPKGIAFVEFASAESVDKALELDGSSHMDRYIKVNISSSAKSGGDRKKSFSSTPSEKPEGFLLSSSYILIYFCYQAHVLFENHLGCMQCFLGNLSFSATEDDLYNTFAGCHPLKFCV
jgi:RNA recognition motif-containing protein